MAFVRFKCREWLEADMIYYLDYECPHVQNIVVNVFIYNQLSKYKLKQANNLYICYARESTSKMRKDKEEP